MYPGQGGLTEQATTEHSSEGGRVPIAGGDHSRKSTFRSSEMEAAWRLMGLGEITWFRGRGR